MYTNGSPRSHKKVVEESHINQDVFSSMREIKGILNAPYLNDDDLKSTVIDSIYLKCDHVFLVNGDHSITLMTDDDEISGMAQRDNLSGGKKLLIPLDDFQCPVDESIKSLRSEIRCRRKLKLAGCDDFELDLFKGEQLMFAGCFSIGLITSEPVIVAASAIMSYILFSSNKRLKRESKRKNGAIAIFGIDDSTVLNDLDVMRVRMASKFNSEVIRHVLEETIIEKRVNSGSLESSYVSNSVDRQSLQNEDAQENNMDILIAQEIMRSGKGVHIENIARNVTEKISLGDFDRELAYPTNEK